ncbi:MAG: hypothetical protein AB1813_04950 [Verrucomicrobiota bacterium]
MADRTIVKHLLVAFGLALLLYVISFSFIHHMRERHGPWQVTFLSDAQGQPSIRVDQPKLALREVTLSFVSERISTTNLNTTVFFAGPKTNVPFGEVIFFDTTFLPGTVTFDFFGHEIELLRRTLVVNKKEISWESGARIELTPKEKLPAAQRPKPKPKR